MTSTSMESRRAENDNNTQEHIMENKIIFIDTMTTGMNPERCGIYRLGGIITSGGRETERFEMRIQPFATARISEQSLWICGETRRSLVTYPQEGEALEFLTGLLSRHIDIRNPRDKAYLAGFNASAMDTPFLREFFRRNGNMRFRDYFHVQTIDLMTLTAFALMNERTGMPDFHLETAANKIGVECPGTPGYDCVSNAKICLDMYRALERRFGTGSAEDTTALTEVTRNYTLTTD